MTEIDWELRYKRLRRRHKNLKAAICFWLGSEFYSRFVQRGASPKGGLYPSRSAFGPAIRKLMQTKVTGVRLLKLLGTSFDELLGE